MLTALSIANIVLIERLDLDFEAGLGVLTGETGAGKSILLDALGLVLGMRADSALVRQGTDKAQVTASFTPPAPDTPLAVLLREAIMPALWLNALAARRLAWGGTTIALAGRR